MNRAYLQLHLAIVLFGFSGILGDLVDLPVTLLVGYRVMIAAVFMALLYSRSQTWLAPRKHPRLYAMGVVLGLHWVAFFGSIQASSVSVGVVCLAAGALFGTAIQSLLQRKAPAVLDLALGALALIGMYMLYSFQVLYGKGILLGLLSAMLSALYGVLNKPLMDRYSVNTVNLYQMGVCTFMLLPALPFYALTSNVRIVPTGLEWLCLLGLGIGCSVIANTLSLKALKHISPFGYLISFNLESVYSLLLATWLLNENQHSGWGELTGMLLVLSAVFLYPLFRSKRFKRSGIHAFRMLKKTPV